jgi:azurin
MLGTIGLAAALALTACGGGGEAESNNTFEVSGTTDLQFEPATLTIPAGEEVTINFQNEAAAGIPHNFVVVPQGQEDAAVEAGAANEGEVDVDNETILVAGDLVESGESEEIEIGDDALAAGTYTYICTYPGHGSVMRGTLTVQ